VCSERKGPDEKRAEDAEAKEVLLRKKKWKKTKERLLTERVDWQELLINPAEGQRKPTNQTARCNSTA